MSRAQPVLARWMPEEPEPTDGEPAHDQVEPGQTASPSGDPGDAPAAAQGPGDGQPGAGAGAHQADWERQSAGWQKVDQGPQAHGRTTQKDANNWAMAAHLSGLAMLVGIPSFVGPLIIWLAGRDKHPFVDQAGKEALNFHLSLLIYGIVLAVLFIPVTILTLGLGLIPLILAAVALFLMAIVFSIVGALKASDGHDYRYPLTMRMLS